jgi:hypothetical protein
LLLLLLLLWTFLVWFVELGVVLGCEVRWDVFLFLSQ